MGTTGKSISITLPIPLVEDLQKGADKVGISRSRFVSNLLLKWQEDSTDEPKETVIPNNCTNREDEGRCIAYGHFCHANQEDADTCEEYKENK